MNLAPKISSEKPNIYEYLDYRKFLNAWMTFLNENGFSMRQIAVASKISTGYLPMVLSGQRNLTLKAIQSMSPHLQLEKSELDYLNELTVLSDSLDQSKRVEAYKKLTQFSGYKQVHQNINDVDAHKYLANWFNVAIREMGQIDGLKLDIEQIRKTLNFKVPKSKISGALDLLKNKGLIKVNKDGSYSPTGGHLDCQGGVYRLSLTEFHNQMVNLGIQSVYSVPRSERELVGHTFALSTEKLDQAKRIMEKALREIQDLGEASESPDSVYQFSMQLFPLAKMKGTEDDSK